ncbi:MAG: glycoside hydrolase family 16 protein [Bacteroidales bacterium]|nr:glycoside hydrolase family 16 protein [Bacteroidales bacterium]
MAGLRSILGIFPDTTRYEQKKNKLAEEYQRFTDIEQTEDFKRFRELEAYLASGEYAEKKQKLLKTRYKDSEEYRTEQEFKRLSGQKDINLFLKTVDSQGLSSYQKTAESQDLTRYEELDKLLKSEDFLKVKQYYALSGKKKFNQSDLKKTYDQYIRLKKDRRIIAFHKFVNNRLYKGYNEIVGSEKLSRFEDLQKFVTSTDFLQQKKSMKKDDFLVSDIYEQFTEYKELKSDADLKAYYKHSKSKYKVDYESVKDSEDLELYNELNSFINSSDFTDQKKAIESARFEDTDEYKELQEFKSLASNSSIKHYFKYSKSKELHNYNNVKDSNQLQRYKELKDKVESAEFQNEKAYLTMKGKQRWLESDECKLEEEFKALKRSEAIVFYFKNIKSKRYNWLRQWTLTFEEHFKDANINKDKWLTKYYWGDKLLDDSYSTEEEFQYISEENIQATQNGVKIITKRDNVQGKAWHPEYGFVPREFDYSSGLLNSGNSFRQKYGTVEAKLKFSKNKDVLEAFWMVSDEKMPHVDIVKANSKTHFGYKWVDSSGQLNDFYKKYSRNKFADKYYIFGLEWTPETLTWFINGEPVAKCVNQLPGASMYLVFSSHLFSPATEEHLPSIYEIEWVKCYQNNSYK